MSLTHSSPSAEVSLVTDASNTHMGAALQQKESGGWRPLAFFSAKLSATQQRYSAFFLRSRYFYLRIEIILVVQNCLHVLNKANLRYYCVHTFLN